jgi:transposase
MKAIHGGKAKNDRIDAYKIAHLLRGGNLPKAYVYPPEMRATRDLLRRRLHLVRRRGNLLAHVQSTHHQYNLAVPEKKVAYAANRGGVAERFADPDVRKSLETDLALVADYDEKIRDLQLHLEKRAKEHDRDAYHRLRSVPGIGKILALTILYEIHDIGRFERVQDFLSYARLVKCEHSSAGKRLGSGGAKVGNVHLKWAFSEAAVLFLRKNPRGQEHLRRLAGKHGKSKALSILAAKLGRAVYHLLRKQRTFDPERFFAMS